MWKLLNKWMPLIIGFSFVGLGLYVNNKYGDYVLASLCFLTASAFVIIHKLDNY